ncbi:MAG: GMC family oxidoreductase [Gemmataceae bacterium]|nr:GMC family oxidoreductase [Gemmataceae bacterium]
MPDDADVVVVGSGAGGATFAHECARLGKQVLVLERGQRYALPRPVHDEQAMLIDKTPYDDRRIEVNGRARQLYMGGVVGGGTALYGAALMRPSADDFRPGKSYSALLPRALWEWPIAYEDLEPFYSEAEILFGVAGDGDDDFGPLPRPRNGFPQRPLPVHPVNQRLMEANRRHGLRPFRLPLAIDPTRCLQCGVCPGYICPTGARRSAAQLLEPAPANLRVVTNTEAERLVLNGKGEPDGVQAVDRSTGQRVVYRARRYVLAAGAIGSPLLLLRSGMTHPLIGRNYMMHYSPIVIGIFRRRLDAGEAFVKQVGFTDWYFGTKDYAHKLGLVQSLPVPGPLMLRKAAPRWLPRTFLSMLRARMLPLVGIIEDLPNPDNRVSWGPDNQPRLQHRFAPYDLERGRRLAGFTAGILKHAGAAFCLTSKFGSEEHVAHQCGTLRFGNDPADAVLDADGRMFGHSNVFAVDGSFMPTSLGVGPALTIMANALRIARIVAPEC